MKPDTITSPDSKEMAEARRLLGRFEAEMEQPEGLVHLSEALSIIADLRAESASEIEKQVAANISLAYMKKTQAHVESLFSREPSVRFENIGEWLKIFWEFEAYGFTLPPDIAEFRSKLLTEKVKREIALMSPSERKEILRQLQAMGSQS